MTRPKLLISARDPGAARNIACVIEAFKRHSSIEVQVAVQDSAVKIFESLGIACSALHCPSLKEASDPGASQLLAETNKILRSARPNAVLTGLSGPGIGIDEALLQLCEGIPTFSLQDSEGWVVRGFGRTAQTYFVASERAAKLTRQQGEIHTIVSGLPAYEMVARSMPHPIDFSRGEAQGAKRMTFYGQPLWDFPGYLATLKSFHNGVRELKRPLKVAFRPHPKESIDQQKKVLNLFEDLGDQFSIDQETSVEASLLRTDVAVSCFSNCLVDAVYLQAYRSDLYLPIGVYLLEDPSLRELLLSGSGGEMPWNLQSGLSLMSSHQDQTASIFGVALSEKLSQDIRAQIKDTVRLPQNSAAVIVQSILDAIGASHE